MQVTETNTTEKPYITVGMCTYKRPSVRDTLWSIANQEGIDLTKLEIVVVDNDIMLSGQRYVEQFARESGLNTKYLSEPRKNIAAARNKILENSSGVWLASIDDDEIAGSTWLTRLISTAESYSCDAVIGKKQPVYPPNTPPWIEEGGFFNPPKKKTGTAMQDGNTGSALINLNTLKSYDLVFNLEFGLTGGSDSDLFFRLFKSGGKITYCDEAVVREPIEPNRVNGKYLTLRAIRAGQCWVRFQRPYFRKRDFFNVVTKTTAKFALNVPLLILSLPFGKARFFKHWLKLADAYGKVSALVGVNKIEIYSMVLPPKSENPHDRN